MLLKNDTSRNDSVSQVFRDSVRPISPRGVGLLKTEKERPERSEKLRSDEDSCHVQSQRSDVIHNSFVE